MSYNDLPRQPTDRPDPSSDRDVRHGRHRSRHAESDAAADAYAEDEYGYAYGDGVSAHPMYGRGPTRPPASPVGGHPSGPPGNFPPDPVVGTRPPGRLAAAGGPGAAIPRLPGVELVPLELDLDEGRTARSREDRRVEAAVAKKSRAGRNLPAAIGVGVLLVAIVLGSLFLWRPAFLVVLALGAGIGVWEMVQAIDGTVNSTAAGGGAAARGRAARANPPLVPLLGGCFVMPVLAWFGGVESLILGLLLTVLAVLVWRLSLPPAGFHRDMAAATLVAVYVPFLIGFAVLLAHPADGDLRVLATLACVVLSDTGGYAVGVFFGEHPMAPTVSPKKSWEGMAGSLVAAAIGGSLLLAFLFDQPWWHGVFLGLAVAVAAVVGDLSESLIKRDLGVKDMSQLLPGHGGLMDRLDSVVFAAPTAFMLMTILAPVGT